MDKNIDLKPKYELIFLLESKDSTSVKKVFMELKNGYVFAEVFKNITADKVYRYHRSRP
jgi:hypothetical protein